MRCLKSFGERIASRNPDRQIAEFQIRTAVMNASMPLALPGLSVKPEPIGEWGGADLIRCSANTPR